MLCLLEGQRLGYLQECFALLKTTAWYSFTKLTAFIGPQQAEDHMICITSWVLWVFTMRCLIPFCLQLISSVDPKFLKLTKMDDKIYSSFRETFKDLDVKLLNADDLKSEKAKEVSQHLLLAQHAPPSVLRVTDAGWIRKLWFVFSDVASVL